MNIVRATVNNEENLRNNSLKRNDWLFMKPP